MAKHGIQLLDLPRELLGLVYDMLDIRDRTKFNMALSSKTVVASSITTPENDLKLSIVHRFFSRRRSITGSAVTRADVSTGMIRFMQQNACDPTVLRLIQASPELEYISCKPSFDTITEVRKQLLADVCTIRWADIQGDEDVIISAIESGGSPCMFDSCMATDNRVRARILLHAGSFAFALVNMMNTRGLLSHVMSLPNDSVFPVEETHGYLSSYRISSIFVNEPSKLRMIVDIGIPPTVRDALLEDAARKLLMPSIKYLMSVGAVF